MSTQEVDRSALEHWRPERIGIIGAGAMGSCLASILGQRVPVVLVCRRAERAAEIVRNGLRTRGLIESHSVPTIVPRIGELPSIGGVSLIFVATKTTAIPKVASELRPILNHSGDQPGAPFVVSYQNGIEPGRQLITALGDDRVLRMVLNLGAVLPAIGSAVEITLSAPPHSIGALNAFYAGICLRVATLLSDAGLETQYVNDIHTTVWTKGVVNAAMNPVCALANATVREILDSPASGIVEKLLAEGAQVAMKDGAALDESFLSRARTLFEAAEDHTPSMVEDIRSGRESEVGQLNRQVIDHGHRLGVPTPTHQIIDALIETFDWKVYRAHREHRQLLERANPLGASTPI